MTKDFETIQEESKKTQKEFEEQLEEIKKISGSENDNTEELDKQLVKIHPDDD